MVMVSGTDYVRVSNIDGGSVSIKLPTTNVETIPTPQYTLQQLKNAGFTQIVNNSQDLSNLSNLRDQEIEMCIHHLSNLSNIQTWKHATRKSIHLT